VPRRDGGSVPLGKSQRHLAPLEEKKSVFIEKEVKGGDEVPINKKKICTLRESAKK